MSPVTSSNDCLRLYPNLRSETKSPSAHTLSEVRAQAGQYDKAIRTQLRVCELAKKVYSGHDLHLFLARIQLMEFYFVIGDYPECRKLAMECMSTIDEAPQGVDVWKHRPPLELRIARLNLADPSSNLSQTDLEKTVQQLLQLELVNEYVYERDLVCYLYCRLLNKEELAAQMIESSKEHFSAAQAGKRKNFAYCNTRMAKVSEFRGLASDLQYFISEIETLRYRCSS